MGTITFKINQDNSNNQETNHNYNHAMGALMEVNYSQQKELYQYLSSYKTTDSHIMTYWVLLAFGSPCLVKKPNMSAIHTGSVLLVI